MIVPLEKGSWNSNGQHFHQSNKTYNTIWPQILEHDIGNPGSGLGQKQQCGGVKPVNGKPTFLTLAIHGNTGLASLQC